MNRYLNDAKSYLSASQGPIIMWLAVISTIIFSITFMISMPRTFFLIIGICIGVVLRHYWTNILPEDVATLVKDRTNLSTQDDVTAKQTQIDDDPALYV